MREVTMKRVLVIVGASGSGKDWIAKNVYPALKRIDVIEPWRRFLEKTFGLSEGELSTQDGKLKVIPNSRNVTVGEYMVGQYQYHREMGVPIGALMLTNQLYEALEGGHNEVVITSIRSMDEASALLRFCKSEDVDLELELLYNRGKLKTSDMSIVDVFGILARHATRVNFINNGVPNG